MNHVYSPMMSLMALWLTSLSAVWAQTAPNITAVVATTAGPIEQYGKFEAVVSLEANYTNPYNYDDIRVFATFAGPDGSSKTVDGFFMQDFSAPNAQTGAISPLNNGVFKVRFSPDQPGSWTYTVYCTTAQGQGAYPAQSFGCSAATQPHNRGFVQVGTSNYLTFDQGGSFVPIGENIGWPQSNAYVDYKRWLDKLRDHGANFFRLWHAHWGLGIEWRNSGGFQGLRRYRQSSSFYQDWLFDYAAEHGLYAMLCIQHHGQVSSNVNPNWSESPYNTANGGPCANTWDFFTQDAARNHVKNRLRYIVARWGYARSIMCWELFNEVDWTDEYEQRRADVANWHAEMAAFIKQLDPQGRPVSTSFAHDYNDPASWQLADIDLTQTHYYLNTPNLERALANGSQQYLDDYAKPTLNGEFGLTGSGTETRTLDPNGIHFHNGLWASLFAGSLGSGAPWFWDSYIEYSNLFYHFRGLSEVANSLPLASADFRPTAASSSGASADLVLSATQGWGALADTSIVIQNGAANTANLSQYLYGSSWNTQYRRPPVFAVTYPQEGQFAVATGASSGTSPRIAIWLDGVLVLEQNAGINQVYSIQVPAGAHSIKVDNTGTDWITIAGYSFSGLGSAVDVYALLAADGSQAAAWVYNNRYNHDYVQANGTPDPVENASIHLSGMADGSYTARWYDCLSGQLAEYAAVSVVNGQLSTPIPSLLWDWALVVDGQPVAASEPDVPKLDMAVYPNPYTPTEALFIALELAEAAPTTIELHDLSGRQLAQLFSQDLPAGSHQIQLQVPVKLPAGLYLVHAQAGRTTGARVLVVPR